MRMKVELTQADDGDSLHGRPELWARVLSEEPLGPQDLHKILAKISDDDMEGYSRTPIKFYADLAGAWEDEPEDAGFEFEQWWIFQKIGA